MREFRVFWFKAFFKRCILNLFIIFYNLNFGLNRSVSAPYLIGLLRRFRPIWPELAWIDPIRRVLGNEKKNRCGIDVRVAALPTAPCIGSRQMPVWHPCSHIGAFQLQRTWLFLGILGRSGIVWKLVKK